MHIMNITNVDINKNYTVEDVAAMLGFSGAHIRRFCAAGDLPGSYRRSPSPRSAWIIPGAAVQSFIDARAVAAK